MSDFSATASFADAFRSYVDASIMASRAFEWELHAAQESFAERFDAAFAGRSTINGDEIYALGVPCVDCLRLVTGYGQGHELCCEMQSNGPCGPGARARGFYAKCGRRWAP